MEKIVSIIILILYGIVMLLVCCIAIFQKENKSKNNVQSKNNVHFYVARDKSGDLWLYIGKPIRGDTKFHSDSNKKVFCLTYCIEKFGLKYENYNYLKWEDEPVEVFINLEE